MTAGVAAGHARDRLAGVEAPRRNPPTNGICAQYWTDDPAAESAVSLRSRLGVFHIGATSTPPLARITTRNPNKELHSHE